FLNKTFEAVYKLLRNIMNKINLEEKLAVIADYWQPKIAGEVNDTAIKLVKLKGEFIWHHHENEDELFWVISGKLRMKFRNKEVVLYPGEFIVVPKGIEHLPIAEEETHVVLIEPKSTLNTGNILSEKTVANPEKI